MPPFTKCLAQGGFYYRFYGKQYNFNGHTIGADQVVSKLTHSVREMNAMLKQTDWI